MSVTATGAGLYEKAKQRMLNKMGKKTTLTRNERVDYVTPRLEEIKSTRKNLSTLFRNFRSCYRKTLWAGTELNVQLIAAWSNEIGERSFVPGINAYIREKSNEEMKIVQEASDDIRTVMETLERISAQFDTYLKREATAPFGEDDVSSVGKYEDVVKAKDAYKAVRTKYSDGMINYKRGFSSPNELEGVRQEYEYTTTDLDSKMSLYETSWREQLFGGTSEFFKVQSEYVGQVSEALSELDIWTSNLSLDVFRMKRSADKRRRERHISKHLDGTASDNVKKAEAKPIRFSLPPKKESRVPENRTAHSSSGSLGKLLRNSGDGDERGPRRNKAKVPETDSGYDEQDSSGNLNDAQHDRINRRKHNLSASQDPTSRKEESRADTNHSIDSDDRHPSSYESCNSGKSAAST